MPREPPPCSRPWRALRARPVPRRDIIVLITDGEEAGLMGARAFVDEHPWKSDVGVVVNLEARGQRGPAIMFETSGRANGPLMAAFANSGAATLANSLTAEVYRRLPNDTDLTVFARQNIAGFNIAFIGGLSAYHTALDRPETLDLGSLQQMGDAALALAVELSEEPLDLDARGTSIYWNPLGAHLVRYPGWLALPLALLAALLWAGAALLARGRGLFESTDLLRAVLFGLLALVLVAMIASAGFWLLVRLAPPLARGPYGLPYDGGLITFGLLALGSGAGAWALARGRLAERPVALALGALAFWLLLAIGVSLMVPGASFLLTWPLVSASLGCAVATFVLSREPKSAPAALLFTLGALPGVGADAAHPRLVARCLDGAGHGRSGGRVDTGDVAERAALGGCQPRAAPGTRGARRARHSLCWSRWSCSTRPGPERPAVDSLAYRLDADTGEARWVSADRQASRSSGVLRPRDGQEPGAREPSDFPFRGGTMLTAPATAISALPPELQTITTESRFLRARLLSPRGGSAAWVESQTGGRGGHRSGLGRRQPRAVAWRRRFAGTLSHRRPACDRCRPRLRAHGSPRRTRGRSELRPARGRWLARGSAPPDRAAHLARRVDLGVAMVPLPGRRRVCESVIHRLGCRGCAGVERGCPARDAGVGMIVRR